MWLLFTFKQQQAQLVFRCHTKVIGTCDLILLLQHLQSNQLLYIKCQAYSIHFCNTASLLIMLLNQLHSFLFSRIYGRAIALYTYIQVSKYIGNFLDFAIAICCNDNRLSVRIALPQVTAIGANDSAGECYFLCCWVLCCNRDLFGLLSIKIENCDENSEIMLSFQ